MDRKDIEKVHQMNLPSKKISQGSESLRRPPPLVRSNTVLSGNNKINKTQTRTYLCR